MSKLLILDLRPVNVETFLEELNPKLAESILGGNISAKILSIHDGVNRVENTHEGANSVNFRDNTISSIDNSDQVYIWTRGYW